MPAWQKFLIGMIGASAPLIVGLQTGVVGVPDPTQNTTGFLGWLFVRLLVFALAGFIAAIWGEENKLKLFAR